MYFKGLDTVENKKKLNKKITCVAARTPNPPKTAEQAA